MLESPSDHNPSLPTTRHSHDRRNEQKRIIQSIPDGQNKVQAYILIQEAISLRYVTIGEKVDFNFHFKLTL